VDERKVTLDARLQEALEADDLDMIEMYRAVEEKFGIEVSDEAAGTIETVRDVIDLIKVEVDFAASTAFRIAFPSHRLGLEQADCASAWQRPPRRRSLS
jgi:acyl carrier protein